MKNYINSVIGSSGYRIFVFAAILLFSSCMRENVQNDSTESEAYVLLTVKLPQSSLPSTRADTPEEAESEILTLNVLVFESDGSGGYTFAYQVDGREINPSGGFQRFRMLMKATDSPLKLLVLINAGQAFTSYLPAAGDSESDVRQHLEIPFTSAGFTGSLPMYGELLMDNGVGAGSASMQVSALRAVARVDVVKDLEVGSDEFILEEVYIYRANDMIKLDHAAFDDPGIPVVSAPTVPAGAQSLASPVTTAVSGGAERIGYIYVPESVAAQTDNEKLNATAVIVGGRWGGAASPITYYRTDFDLSGPNFGQILRNHLYTFSIKKVTAPGWSSPEEAANNFASSIVVEVQAWEDFSSVVYFGENRFAVSSRDISLPYVGNRTRRIDVESNLEYSIQWLDDGGNPTGNATSQPNTVINNGVFEVSIVMDAGDPASVSHLAFRTLSDNYDGDVIEHRLRISVENWTMDITVCQENTAMYSTRHFNILTGIDNGGYPAGNLGTTTVLPSGYNATWFLSGGLAMRKILDEHFKPDDVVKIGGFSFEQLSDNNTYFNATSDTNVQEMDRIIRQQDIIYLSWSVTISNRVANLISEWLSESPRRVLILGCDDNATNVNLIPLLPSAGTLTFGVTSGSNYTRAAASSPATDEFFDGPFGVVASTATFTAIDATAGHYAGLSSEVTPLVLTSAGGMVFGVNKTQRIIYHGDANLFLSPPLTNETGSVSNNLDRLMGNVWAWAVEQVIYGGE